MDAQRRSAICAYNNIRLETTDTRSNTKDGGEPYFERVKDDIKFDGVLSTDEVVDFACVS